MAESERIIVIGAGTVGSYISELLQQEHHEVVVIDTSAERLVNLGESLDVQTIQGHGADPALLRKAGVADAHLVLALTNIDEVNLLACYAAKRLGAAKCTARARSPWCLDTSVLNLREGLDIDLIMNPEHLTALEIIRFLGQPDALALASYAYGKVQLRSFTVDPKAKFAGKTLKECTLPEGVLVVVRSQNGETIIPNGDTILEAGDKLTIIGATDKLPAAQKLFHTSTEHGRNIVIGGGGFTGLFLAERLESSGFKVKLFEWNRERCEELSGRLNATEVVHGDMTDIGFLKEERISTADVFVAVTGDDENNLMACLLAKELEVPQTVVKIARPDYTSLVQKVGVSLALSPRHVMAERILTMVSRGRVRAVTLLEGGKVEVIELLAGHGSAMVGKPLSRLSIPEGAIISAIIHLGKTKVPHGGDVIEPGDTVIAVGLRESIDEVEEALRGD